MSILINDRPAPDILREAAQLIRENGLSKGAFHNRKTDCFCTLGAVVKVLDPEWEVPYGRAFDQAKRLLADELEDRGINAHDDSGFFTVTHWNDQPERTADEVVELLETTAAKLS